VGQPIKAQWAASYTEVSPLLIGETVPDAKIIGTDGNEHTLASLTQEKPTIIIFYRGKWCGNCVRHFSEEIAPNLQQINSLGYNLLNVSPDLPDTLIATSRLVNLPASVFYSDGTGDLSVAMGIAAQQAERMLTMLDTYSGGMNKGFLPVPAVIILDTDRKILFQHITPLGISDQGRVRGQYLIDILEALNALKD